MNKAPSMKSANARILTINGGSSSIKFALFEAGDSLRRILEGGIERIGLPKATFRVKGLNAADDLSRSVTALDHTQAVGALMDWIEEGSVRDALTAVGHRVVHGGPAYSEPQRVTAEMVEDLHRLSPFDPDHLPEEILLTVGPQWELRPVLARRDQRFAFALPLDAYTSARSGAGNPRSTVSVAQAHTYCSISSAVRFCSRRNREARPGSG